MILQAIVYELMEQRWRLRPDAGILFLLIMIGLWTCMRIWWRRDGDEACSGWDVPEQAEIESEPKRWNEVG